MADNVSQHSGPTITEQANAICEITSNRVPPPLRSPTSVAGCWQVYKLGRSGAISAQHRKPLIRRSATVRRADHTARSATASVRYIGRWPISTGTCAFEVAMQS